MKVLVKTISHNEPREVELTSPLVTELRSKVAVACYEIAPEDSHRVRLIFKGRVLEDEKDLNDYGINDGDIVHAVIRPVLQGSSSATASTNTNNPASSSTGQQTDTAAPRASNGLPRGMPQIPNIPGINFEQVADNVFMGSMSLDISDPNIDQSTLLNIISNAIGGPLPRNASSSNNNTNNGTNNGTNNNSNNNNANRSSIQNINASQRERVGLISESNNNNSTNNASNGNSSHLSPAVRQLINTFQSFLSSIIIILRDMQRENANLAQIQTMLNLISSQAMLLSSIMSVTSAQTQPNSMPGVPQQYFYPPCPPYVSYPPYPMPYYNPYGYPAQYNMFAHPQPPNLQNQNNPLNYAPPPLPPHAQSQENTFSWPPQMNPLPLNPDPLPLNPSVRVYEPSFVQMPAATSPSPSANTIPVAPVPIVQPNAEGNRNTSNTPQNASNQATNNATRTPVSSDILNADTMNSLDQTLNVAVSAISSAFGGSDNTSNAISGLLSNIIGPNGVINSSNIRSFSRNVTRANNQSSANANESNEDDSIGFD